MDTSPDKQSSGDKTRFRSISFITGKFSKLTTSQKLSTYNAIVLTVGAVLAAIAWFPDFESKKQSASAFSIIRDNPTGVLRTRDIGTLPDGRHIYDISYTLILKNTSNSAFNVEFSLDRMFLGDVHYNPSSIEAKSIAEPPNIWDDMNSFRRSDVIDWRLLTSNASVSEDNDSDIEEQLKNSRIVSSDAGQSKTVDHGGGMIGRYSPQHVTSHTAHYLLVSLPKNYAVIEITYGLSLNLSLWEQIFGTDRSPFYEANPTSETVLLKDATDANAKCKFGVITQNGRTGLACEPMDAATKAGEDTPQLGGATLAIGNSA